MELREIFEKTIAGDASLVKELVEQAIDEDASPSEITPGYLIPAMTGVGACFEQGGLCAGDARRSSSDEDRAKLF